MDNMPSLYAKYLTERTDDKILEGKEGFVTYRYLNGSEVYIIDIFVLTEWRQQHIASRLADTVCREAKQKGCTTLIGTVNLSCKGSKTSILALIGYGMKAYQATDNVILFKKDL